MPEEGSHCIVADIPTCPYELSDSLAYSGTASTAATGFSKEWELQLGRLLLGNEVPRSTGPHAAEKEQSRELYSLLADRRSVGRCNSLLRILECHRSDMRKVAWPVG